MSVLTGSLESAVLIASKNYLSLSLYPFCICCNECILNSKILPPPFAYVPEYVKNDILATVSSNITLCAAICVQNELHENAFV